MTQSKAIRDLIEERRKQDEKWGVQNHPDFYSWVGGVMDGETSREAGRRRCRALGIPTEEEAREALLKSAQRNNTNWAQILLEEVSEAISADPDAIRDELIQVAAVAIAWVECLDRQEPLSEENE